MNRLPPGNAIDTPPAVWNTQPSTEPAWRPEPARISVEQYHAMGEAGILTPADRVELLEGVIVGKPLKGSRHVGVVKRLVWQVAEHLPATHHATREDPVTLLDSEPEPDISVLVGTEDDYLSRHPRGTDCLLVIEVSDSTLTRDLFKASAYAAGGVPEYWIVDLTGRRIIAHRGPSTDGYSDVVTSDSVETPLPGGIFRVAIGDLLGE